MSHIQQYNVIESLLRMGDFSSALSQANDFLAKLRASGSCYGWNRFPYTSNIELDSTLREINAFLTGECNYIY